MGCGLFEMTEKKSLFSVTSSYIAIMFLSIQTQSNLHLYIHTLTILQATEGRMASFSELTTNFHRVKYSDNVYKRLRKYSVLIISQNLRCHILFLKILQSSILSLFMYSDSFNSLQTTNSLQNDFKRCLLIMCQILNNSHYRHDLIFKINFQVRIAVIVTVIIISIFHILKQRWGPHSQGRVELGFKFQSCDFKTQALK